MAYLSNMEFHNQGYRSGLLTSPLDRTKPVLGDCFLDGSEQAVLHFYWGDMDQDYLGFQGMRKIRETKNTISLMVQKF